MMELPPPSVIEWCRAVVAAADAARATSPVEDEVAPIGGAPARAIEAKIDERMRVLSIVFDGDGALSCAHSAAALGRTESALRWHCSEGSGPKQLPARRGHRHRLTDLIDWEKRQLR